MGQWSSPTGAIINKPRRKTNFNHSGIDGEEEMDAAMDWYSVQFRTMEWKQQSKDSHYLRQDSECSIVHFAKGNDRRQSNANSRLQLNKGVCLLHLPMFVINLYGNYIADSHKVKRRFASRTACLAIYNLSNGLYFGSRTYMFLYIWQCPLEMDALTYFAILMVE
jgi:hypothetical protein